MKKYSYGPAPRSRTKRLLEALMAYAAENEEGELHNIIHQGLDKSHDGIRLIFRTNIKVLVQLINAYETAFQKDYEDEILKWQVQEALHHLKDTLGILQDHRLKVQGSEVWTFSLLLWYSCDEINRNLKAVDDKWPSSKSPVVKINKTPHLNAIQALYASMQDEEILPLTVRGIQNTDELTRLWLIDDGAYGQNSIPLSVFYHWWENCQLGLKALFRGEEILGAFGIWPLPEACSLAFQEGLIKEVNLVPCHGELAQYNTWYVSGIVLKEDFRSSSKRNPIQLLLSHGITIWLESGSIAFPVKILALATSAEGERLLHRFSFIRTKEAHQMIEGYPLYVLRASSKEDLISILKKRYLC
jgi:Effector-associated domain 4